MADVCIPSSAGVGKLNLLCSLNLAGKAAGSYSVSMQLDISKLNTLQIIFNNMTSTGSTVCNYKLALGGNNIVDERASNNNYESGCCHVLIFPLAIRTEALGLCYTHYSSTNGAADYSDALKVNLPTSGATWTITLSSAIATGKLEIYGA